MRYAATLILSCPLVALALLLVGCSSEASDAPREHPCTPAQRHTVVFIDRSLNARPDSTALADIQEAVREATEQTLGCQGDRLDVFALYAQTGSAYRVSYEMTQKPFDPSEHTRRVREERERQWENRRSNERYTVAQLVRQRIVEAELPEADRRWTDLLGSLRVLYEVFRDQGVDVQKRVLYLGDMRESMDGPGRRDFYTRPPASVEEARQWAEEDVARLRREGLLPEGALQGVRVEVRRSTLDRGRPGREAVHAYWDHVFRAFGASDLRVR